MDNHPTSRTFIDPDALAAYFDGLADSNYKFADTDRCPDCDCNTNTDLIQHAKPNLHSDSDPNGHQNTHSNG